MSGSSIEIDRISVAYGDAVPLTALSLSVRAGEFLSLLGPSGCGKTTTLRSVAGFSNISAGDIRIGGTSVSRVPPNRRQIGMVYQDYALFPHMTVAENIGFGLKMRRTPSPEIAARVKVGAEQLKLSRLVDRYPSQLSGGQQQRVALARALVIKPTVLLLDEPMAALDKQLRADMQFELRELQRSVGITTLFVTHDQEEALTLSDRIAVMREGKILQVDAPDIVYNDPASLFVAEFVGVANMIHAQIEQHASSGPALRLEGSDEAFPFPGHARGKVAVMVRPEHVRIAHAPTEHAICLDATILNFVFAGPSVKYQAQLHSGQLLRVDASAGSHGAVPVGSKVKVGWNPADMRIFRDGALER